MSIEAVILNIHIDFLKKLSEVVNQDWVLNEIKNCQIELDKLICDKPEEWWWEDATLIESEPEAQRRRG